MLWKTFKVEIRKIAKSQNKKAYHRMSTKIQSLEEEKATITMHPDFDLRDDLRTNHPFSSSYHHHLPRERWVAVLSFASLAGAPSSRGLAPCIPLSPLAMDTTTAQEDANDSFRINALGFGITPWNE
jgi:hypothetical protein